MYSQDKFFVTHSTSSWNLKSILEARSIQPLILKKKLYEEKYKEEIEYKYISDFYEEAKDKEKYIKSVFYGFVFPNKNGTIKYEPQISSVHFVFSSKIIQDNANMYGCEGVNDLPIFCKGWNYGAIDKNCYYYNCKESLEENLNTWRNIALQEKEYMNAWTGTSINEILLEGEMPLDLDLVCIYAPDYLEKFNLDKNESPIEKLMKQYPEYKWVRNIPELQKLVGAKDSNFNEMYELEFNKKSSEEEKSSCVIV
jgi:hypothetical protein